MKLNGWLATLALTGQGILATPSSDQIEVDVAIIGGGATGSYAAVRLREDYGKKVLVIEKQNRLGGHVHAYSPGKGQSPINYGVQAYLDRKTTTAFFKRFNVGLIDPDLTAEMNLVFATENVDFNTGKKVNADYGAIDAITGLTKYGEFAKKYQSWFADGYFQHGEVPQDLLLPFGEFLKKHNLGGSLAILRNLLWLSNALETPTWSVMAVAGHPQIDAFGLGVTGPGFKWPETHSSETLYDRVLDLIKDDVLLESTVSWSNRTADGVQLSVQTPQGVKHVKAKKLLIAATPSPDNVGTWDLDKKEKGLFSKFSWESLFVGIISNTGLPSKTTGIRNALDNQTDYYLPSGNFVDSFDRAGQADLWTTRVIGRDGVTLDEAKALIHSTFKNIKSAGTYNVNDPDIIRALSHGKVVPKVCAKELKDGFYNKLYSLQGYRSTWWTGLTFAPDYSSILWDFTEKLFDDIVSGL